MSDRSFERAVHDWLEEGSDQTPPTAIHAVLFAIKTNPQQRDLLVPRRVRLMPASLRFAAAAVIVAAGGALALLALVPRVDVGPSPAPSPTLHPVAEATPSLSTSSAPPDRLDTGAWIPYVSPHNDYAARYPSDWRLQLASIDADVRALLDEPDTRFDQLIAPCEKGCIGRPVLLAVTSLPFDSEAAFDSAFIDRTATERCVPPRYKWEAMAVAGAPAWAFVGCEALAGRSGETTPTFTVLAFSGGRGYVFTAHIEPGDSLYQNTREMMYAFISTVRLERE